MLLIKPIVVNLFGAPGAGKSTGAAFIFAMLKTFGINAELVTEFAKDKVYEDSKKALQNQAYIFGEQSFRLSRCVDDVEVIVTDSPLLLSIIYNQNEHLNDSFNHSVLNDFNSYKNWNYYVSRVKPYNPSGRLQTVDESDHIATAVKQLLKQYDIDYCDIDGCLHGYCHVIREVIWCLRPGMDIPEMVFSF